LGHLRLIVSDASYAMIAPSTAVGPTLWVNRPAPGCAPENMEGTAARIDTATHVWEEAVLTFRTLTSVQQALKKQIITVFKPIHLDILNDGMVTSREMLDHLFMTYGNITAVDLENNFEQMRRAWDPHQPVEYIFKQIQDCANYSEAGDVIIGHPQQINVGYAKIFSTGHFMSACRRWNEIQTLKKLGHNSRHTLLLRTGSTIKCKVNLQHSQDIMQQTPLWVKQKIKWLRLPLALWPTLHLPQQPTVES
jgi:hypothetical protein